MTASRMSKRPEGIPLAEYDPELSSQLVDRLRRTLTETLRQPAELSNRVGWTVEQDENGLWMTMTFPDGTYSAVGGDWPQDHKGLLWYVDDVAYKLAGQGGAPCHDGE